MKLFVIYIGGQHPKSLIEVHDFRFVVAKSLEDTFPVLRNSWWGEPKSLHIDAWGILNYVDGYNITLVPKEDILSASSKKIFFVNLGGYDPSQFTELHENIFIIEETPILAKAKAKSKVSNWVMPHKDFLYDIDNVLDISEMAHQYGYELRIDKDTAKNTFEFQCCYLPIGQ